MVSPIAAARPVPTSGAARTASGRGQTSRPGAASRKAAGWEAERGLGAGASLSAGPAWRGAAGTSGCSGRAARGAPPGRTSPGQPSPGGAGHAARRGALGGSEPARGHRLGPCAPRAQPAAPRGRTPGPQSPCAALRAAGPEPPGLEARPAPLLRPSRCHGFLEKTGRPRRARPCGEALSRRTRCHSRCRRLAVRGRRGPRRAVVKLHLQRRSDAAMPAMPRPQGAGHSNSSSSA